MKYRSRTDIAAAILEIALDGSIKTKITYRAFLSFPQLKEYLSVLEERESCSNMSRPITNTARPTRASIS